MKNALLSTLLILCAAIAVQAQDYRKGELTAAPATREVSTSNNYQPRNDMSASYERAAQADRTATANANNYATEVRASHLEYSPARDNGYEYYSRPYANNELNSNNVGHPANLPAHGHIAARKSHIDGRYYYYCTSGYTRMKRDNGICKRPVTGDPQFDWYNTRNPRFWLIYNTLSAAHLGYELPTEVANREITPKYFSFDGYIVYDSDTLKGIVTILDKAVFIEWKKEGKPYEGVAHFLENRRLKDIVLFKGLKEFHLTRVADNKKMWRVLHSGKLNIYDSRYHFVTADNIDRSHLRISTNGRDVINIRTKEELVAAINQAYGLNLQAAHYTWKALFTLINKLD